MPISTGAGAGSASVFTKALDSGCPQQGDGVVAVGIDVDADGIVDATSDPLDNCFLCEAFAAPDVDGDGVSEVAVSTAGADGFGVWLFSISASPPSIQPIQLVDAGDSTLHVGPLEFGWVDVYTHTSSAGCLTGDQGPVFALYSVDKLTPAQVQTISMTVSGTTAAVTDIAHETMPLDRAPMPTSDLCGAPIYGTAAELAVTPGVNIGLDVNLCDVSHLSADFNGDGANDTAYVGSPLRNGTCPPEGSEVDAIVAVDYDSDGTADGAPQPLSSCLYCQTFAAIDFNADGASELVILLSSSSTPMYGVYESAVPGRAPGFYPAIVNPGSEQFPEGQPLTFFAGGDEGFTGGVECENFPDHPVLVVWASDAPVDGGPSAMRDIVMTKLTMRADGTFAAVDALHQRQPVSDPLPFDFLAKGCGVAWA
jgi:hypothetical protein